MRCYLSIKKLPLLQRVQQLKVLWMVCHKAIFYLMSTLIKWWAVFSSNKISSLHLSQGHPVVLIWIRQPLTQKIISILKALEETTTRWLRCPINILNISNIQMDSPLNHLIIHHLTTPSCIQWIILGKGKIIHQQYQESLNTNQTALMSVETV